MYHAIDPIAMGSHGMIKAHTSRHDLLRIANIWFSDIISVLQSLVNPADGEKFSGVVMLWK